MIFILSLICKVDVEVYFSLTLYRLDLIELICWHAFDSYFYLELLISTCIALKSKKKVERKFSICIDGYIFTWHFG